MTNKTGECAGKLNEREKQITPKKIVMPFNTNNNFIYSGVTAGALFENSDPKRCPILNCTLMQPDCKYEYRDGISLNNANPFSIFAITNLPESWNVKLCLVCHNKDEIVSVNIDFTQRSCI